MERTTTGKMLAQRRQLRDLERNRDALLHGTELNIAPTGASTGTRTSWPASTSWSPRYIPSCASAGPDDRRMVRAISNPNVDVIGHPTPAIGTGRPSTPTWTLRRGRTHRHGAGNQQFPDRLDLDGELVRRAIHAGVRFAISTDAHAVPHLGYIKYGVAMAQRAGRGRQSDQHLARGEARALWWRSQATAKDLADPAMLNSRLGRRARPVALAVLMVVVFLAFLESSRW